MSALPYIGPFIVLFFLYKHVWFIEFGDRIIFQRSYGKKAYGWQDLRSVTLEVEKKRVMFFPVTYEYLKFKLTREGITEFHSYRVTTKSKKQIFELIENHSPKTKVG